MVVLRDYQLDALARIQSELNRHGRTLAVLATGLGKTTIFSEFIRRVAPWRVLMLAHREELITQAAAAIERIAGERPGVEMAEQRVDDRGIFGRSRIVVASVQTLSLKKRQERFAHDAFKLIVIDEAHHATAPSYTSILNYFSGANVLGVTATPIRGDGESLCRVFPSVACDLSVPWGIDNGWLCPIRQRVVKVDGLDFGAIKTTQGDWSASDLDAILAQEGPLHSVARPTLELVREGQTLVFCAGVNQARALSAVIDRYRPGCSRWLCGETGKDERRAILDDYKAGRVQCLVNVAVLTEGFDAPATAFVVVARPTKSLSLYVQMLGRATRTLPGLVDGLDDPAARRAAIAASSKPFATVLDFVGSSNTLDPKQMTAADVLAGDRPQKVKERAKQLLAERPAGGPVQETLDKAEALVEAERDLMAEEEERRRRIKAEVTYRVEDSGTIGVGDEQRLPAMHEPATPKQRGMLYRLGVPWDDTAKITKKQAQGWIGRLLEKKEEKAS